MNAVHLVHNPEPVYKFKDRADVPDGVTPEGVMEERRRIATIYGHATAKNSAEAVLAAPVDFPNLRGFAPATAEDALRLAMEEAVRKAYRSIVEVVVQQDSPGKGHTVELRVFHAVPVEGLDALAYEPIEVVWRSPEQKLFLIRKLRNDARVFAQRLETVLAELEYWER